MRSSRAQVFLSFLLLVAVAMMNLITAVIVEHAMGAARADEENQARETELKRKRDLDDLLQCFREMDDDAMGSISKEEFETVMQVPKASHFSMRKMAWDTKLPI